MKIRHSVLCRYLEAPDDPRQLRDLLDDTGLEVKRLDRLPDGDLALALELLANRGDHHCYAGIARELAGRLGGSVQLPPILPLSVGESPVPVHVETDGCLRYTATLFERTDPGLGTLSPQSLAPILAAEQSPVSAPVDATNLSNLEFGQPTHAFDADKIEGALRVRSSRPGEQAWPLFAPEPVELPTGTLIIADDVKVLGIAGVIGCEECKTTDQTRRVLLESAAFDPVRVRKAARALNLHTDASARFERGSDPSAPLIGAGRVAWLLVHEAGWSLRGTTGDVGRWVNPRRQIPLSVPAAASFLEYPLHAQEIADRLGRYGFRVSGQWPDWQGDESWPLPAALHDAPREKLRNLVLVEVPPHRLWDVEDAADLYEELARSIGYNETPEHLPPVELGSLPSLPEQRKLLTSQILVGHGFYEVVVDGFHARELVERLPLPLGHPLAAHVQTLNALDRGYGLLKNSPLPQALEGVATNLNLRLSQIKAFEWTRTFHPDKTAPNGVCRETPVLWAIACGADREPGWADKGRAVDAWTLKGIVQNLAIDLHLPLTVGPPDPDYPVAALLHPGRSASVRLGGVPIGALGEVHPGVLGAFRIKRARPVYLEIQSEPLLGAPSERLTYRPPSTNQPIERSLAFTLPHRVRAGEIAQTLTHAGPSWLARVDVTDLYAHRDEEGAPLRTITFALRFDTDQAARTGDEVNQTCDALIAAVQERWGDRGVRLRE
ncbi:MAG: phenylalanine--tRNA ligase subunit beta [Deltaproteobacteria bacterium]|nr:MAG: phenylalanine--tRNA ligase subunit beta [Deltaproteobacteria bacterium]